jgi:hypothetical protein
VQFRVQKLTSIKFRMYSEHNDWLGAMISASVAAAAAAAVRMEQRSRHSFSEEKKYTKHM